MKSAVPWRTSTRSAQRPRVPALSRIVLLLAFGLAGARAHAQQTRFQAYSDEQGLGNLSVTAIAQDRAGFILVGTEGGLYRYDSVGFIPLIGLPADQQIDDMQTDASGRIWVEVDGGLYTWRDGGFGKVVSGQPIPVEGIHRLVLRDHDVVVSSGRIVLRAALHADPGLERIDAFAPFFSPAMVSATPALAQAGFVVADGSALLVGCGSSICRADGGHVEVFDQSVGLPADTWQVAMRSRDGTLWARSLDRLAWRPPGAAAFKVVPIPGSHIRYRTHPDTLQLLEDPNGHILTQTDDGLLMRIGQDWQPCLSQQEGHPEGTIRVMTFDREGLLWLGSRGGGVFRSIGYGVWEHWNTSNGLSNNLVWGMVRTPGQPLWVTTDADAAPITGHRTGAQTIGGANFNAVATQGGRMWFAPFDAPLARVDPAAGTSIRVGHMNATRTMLVDGGNRLWIGGNQGLFRIDDADAPVPVIRPETGLAAQTIFSVMERSPGEIWAVGQRAIYRRQPSGAWQLMTSPAIFKSQPRSLAFRSRDELWVSSSSAGVLRFHLGERLVPLPAIAAPTIGSNTIMFVRRDGRGWMWIGTDHGIDMFDGRVWRHFDKDCGPSSNDMGEGAIFEDVDGSMWFGTSRGLSHLLDPAHLQAEAPLHPMITRVMLGERRLDARSPLHLDWSHAPLIVSFAAIDFRHERSVRFRYRMQGVDTGWNITTAHEVRYAGLPPGKLVFEVSAFDPIHGSDSKPTGLVIKMRAPWWRRWWFYGADGVAVLAAVIGTWRLRIRLLLRSQRLLEQMVQDRTREIEQARRELLLQATSDSLTGLANRRAIMTHLEGAMAEATRRGSSLAVLLIDIDHFKKINDSRGHLVGDAVLQQLGRRMHDALDATEAVGRYGGEEFLLVMPDPSAEAVVRAGRLRRELTKGGFDLGGLTGPVTISGGLTWLRPYDSVLTLLARADAALYEAKRRGRDRIIAVPDDGPGPDGMTSAPARDPASFPAMG